MILAFDIGGTRLRAARFDGVTLLPLGECATPPDLPAFLSAIAAFVTPDIRALSLSIAGVIDPATGKGRVANIPAIDGIALAPALEQATRRPALVLNDADCFALAEARAGAGRGHASVFGVILGTGVGGGLVIGGQLVTGAGGFAGEWGHGPVLRGDLAFACGCGMTGCLDTIGSARGIERLDRHLNRQSRDSRQLLTDWHRGDPAAARVVDLWASALGGPLAMVLNVTGASIVPVGGGLATDAALIARLDRATRAGLLRGTLTPVVTPAECGPDAGLLGAAWAGWHACPA